MYEYVIHRSHVVKMRRSSFNPSSHLRTKTCSLRHQSNPLLVEYQLEPGGVFESLLVIKKHIFFKVGEVFYYSVMAPSQLPIDELSPPTLSFHQLPIFEWQISLRQNLHTPRRRRRKKKEKITCIPTSIVTCSTFLIFIFLGGRGVFDIWLFLFEYYCVLQVRMMGNDHHLFNCIQVPEVYGPPPKDLHNKQCQSTTNSVVHTIRNPCAQSSPPCRTSIPHMSILLNIAFKWIGLVMDPRALFPSTGAK